jgi:hypothetical protein
MRIETAGISRVDSLIESVNKNLIRESALPTPVYIQNANLPPSRTPSTPSLLPTRDLPAVSIPINYSFVTFNYSFKNKI